MNWVQCNLNNYVLNYVLRITMLSTKKMESIRLGVMSVDLKYLVSVSETGLWGPGASNSAISGIHKNCKIPFAITFDDRRFWLTEEIWSRQKLNRIWLLCKFLANTFSVVSDLLSIIFIKCFISTLAYKNFYAVLYFQLCLVYQCMRDMNQSRDLDWYS